MKILIVTQCFYPDVYAINDIVTSLVKRGNEITVLTGLPDYTTSTIPEEYRHGKNRHQNFNGADVWRVPVIARHHGAVFRSLNYISFVITGCLKARLKKWQEFDIIYVWGASPVTMAFPALTLKKKYRKKLFFYCLDLWPESVKAMGFKENTLPYRMIHAISKKAYSQCDHIAVSSKPFFEYLEKTNSISRNQMSYLPQFASADMLDRDFTKKPDNHFDFLYIGNIGKAQDMNCLISAIARLKTRTDTTFHIIGSGSEFESTKLLAKNLGADKIIKFYGTKPFREAMQYYNIADVCILTLDGSNHIGDTLPGKIQTYMAAGKPIIGALNGAGYEVIQESRCGKAVHAGDAEGLADLFLDYINHQNEYLSCGENAKKYFLANFTEEQHFKTLETILNDMISNKRKEEQTV